MDCMTAVAILSRGGFIVTSKLFHAVVGVGISLGSVAACGGSIAKDGDAFASPDAATPLPPKPEAGVQADAGAPDVFVAPDAATPPDAALDSPPDIVDAAFCDAAWPITKSGREVCGAFDACEQIAAPWCFGPGPEGTCQMYPLECVGAEWHCMGNSKAVDNGDWPTSCQ